MEPERVRQCYKHERIDNAACLCAGLGFQGGGRWLGRKFDFNCHFNCNCF